MSSDSDSEYVPWATDEFSSDDEFVTEDLKALARSSRQAAVKTERGKLRALSNAKNDPLLTSDDDSEKAPSNKMAKRRRRKTRNNDKCFGDEPSKSPDLPVASSDQAENDVVCEAEQQQEISIFQTMTAVGWKKIHTDFEKRRLNYCKQNFDVFEPFLATKLVTKVKNEGVAEDSIQQIVEHFTVDAQPPFLTDVTMRDYQVHGLNWMLHQYDNGFGCILADEMGLGKTLQTISFLGALKHRGFPEPYLVVVPLSVLGNWMSELQRFCPSLKIRRIHGLTHKEDLKKAKADIRTGNLDVIVTTFHMLKSTNSFFGMHFRVMVLDEGHIVKNVAADVHRAACRVTRSYTLLLTGTPVQNDLTECFALLKCIEPEVFSSGKRFEDAFSAGHTDWDAKFIHNVHKLMKLICLRRLKSDVCLDIPPKTVAQVMCPLAPDQVKWYRESLIAHMHMIENLERKVTTGEKVEVQTKKKLANLLIQLRMLSNHPYFLPEAEPADPDDVPLEGLVNPSGKMRVLDRLLDNLFKDGHRVVLFTQFLTMLDIFEDYLTMKGVKYLRLDGSTDRVLRQINITRFNQKGSDIPVFIASTRAGGLGVNLHSADTLVLFDSDWNPQQDLQAIARVHRIGQTKPVTVYRLVSRGTVEERMLSRASRKLGLEKAISEGCFDEEDASPGEMFRNIFFSCQTAFGDYSGADEVCAAENWFTNEKIDGLLASSLADATAEVRPQLSEEQATELPEYRPIREFLGKRWDSNTVFQKPIKEVRKEREIEDATQITSKKRSRSSRVIKVESEFGTHTILRANNYSLEEGEPSVFDREARASAHQAKRKRATFNHTEYCQACGMPGELVCCSYCPMTFHKDCYPGDIKLGAFGEFRCPHHNCAYCDRKDYMLRCDGCPNAYCEDHMPPLNEIQFLGEVSENLRLIGYTGSDRGMYIYCCDQCRTSGDQTHQWLLSDKSPAVS